ncbi:hypothetical protein DOY81_012759 [Sarcophaga bullata]|nr:hypothetical protein DOY81_012759 [Sarcophaga bullata]
MDKDQETLDILDIPNSISLNPFDRPPNIMDDELNSVTQEELEANLSTDCPFGVNIEKTPAQNNNDMWEQLIQSVLEDTSTQDAVVNSEQTNEFNEGILKEGTTHPTQHALTKKESIQIQNHGHESLKMVTKESPYHENQDEDQEDSDKKLENDFKNEEDENISKKAELQDEMSIKKEDIVLDITTEEEQMLEQCIYDVGVDDDQEEICQVEVYASNREDGCTKYEELSVTENANAIDEDDSCSDISVMSVGYLEPMSSNEIVKNEEDIKEHQLSSIISDHCYSQEVSINSTECDVLKQNVINHIVLKNPINVDHKKLSKFVDKILNNLDNNNLEIMLNTLNIEDKPTKLSPKRNEDESKSDVQENANTTNIIREGDEISQGTQNVENQQKEQNAVENNQDVNDIIKEEANANNEISTKIKNFKRESESANNQSEACLENQNLITINNTLIDSEPNEIKSTSEPLADNCSEPIEHQLFDEEFELLCKNGLLPLKNDPKIKDTSTKLLEKLKEFASHILTDCEIFSSSSRNKLSKRNRKSKTTDHSSSLNSSSSTSSSSSENDEPNTQIPLQRTVSLKEDGDTISDIKPLPFVVPSCDITKNYSQDYDDGLIFHNMYNLKYLNRFSFTNQCTSILSEDSDSAKEGDDDQAAILKKQESLLHEDGDSDNALIFDINSKKNKRSTDNSSAISTADGQRTCKSQKDDMSVHSESDKENLTADRKEKKSTESMDEDEKNDREIDRLTNISGLSKRPISNTSSLKNSEKTKAKVAQSKNLTDRFDFMDVEFGSEDEVKSEAEEEVITEQQFLRNYNEDIKRQMLDDSSTDSEAVDEEDDELSKTSSGEDEEGGTKSPLVEKFLKTYVVDDSDNDIEDNDEDDEDDIELDSDKEEEEKTEKNENKVNDVVSNEECKAEKTEDNLIDGEAPTTAEMDLLNDNFLFRKRSSKPQKLDKMLSDAEKRKNISKIDAELISLSSESSNSDVEAVDVDPSQKPRSLKPMLRPDQLAGETIKAQKLENERISRLEKKHNMLEKVLKEHPDVDKKRDLILDYIKETKTFIRVHPGIVKYLKPHQFDGVRFMYDSCYGGVDALKKSSGSGCILAHCMGLGKTLQLISLLHTVISYKELKTTKILVLCPKSTVMNWADEIIRWLGPLRQKNVKVYTFSDTSDINEKLSIVKEWSLSNHTRAGCLLIGYEAFRTLVFYHSYKNRGNVSSERLEEIRLLVNKYLLTPGADLVVCDEGHIIKNSNSAISKAVAKIETPRRIVLTGTPIQNNLKEYYSMVNFIKPLFLGTEKEFANLYANPIKNGQHKDSSKNDIKIMKQRSFVLHKKLSKFVQRKEAELLKTFLPTKFEYVLFIPMTDVQNNLYQHILTAIKNRDDTYRGGKGLITDYTCLRKIWTHPKVLEDAWKNAINQRNKKEIRNKLIAHNSDDDQPDDIYDSQTGQMSVTNDWWRHLVKESDLESVMPSNKLRTMFNILQMCEEKGEKCLIFSAFVAVLNVVEYFFKKISENDPAILKELNINRNSKWILGQDYYRLDGKTPKSIRHAMINEFNNVTNKMARVFLISAKAGGQGINLIGANRVIILDTSWNPSNDQQNIFRVFRLGQKRSCYIYRLLAMGTMEEKVYSRSVTKQAMSFRVVDEQQIDRHYNMAELAELYTLTFPDKNNRPTPILPQDSILARLLRNFPELVYKYHEHDSLLENKVEQELSEQEKNEAWSAYERDLQMNSEVREVPNIDDFHNKFNPSNLQNYLSPFSGLDVSNNQNASSGKNVSILCFLLFA